MQSGYGVPELQQFMVDGCTNTASLIPFGYDMNAAAAAASPMQLQTQQQQHGHSFFRPPPNQSTPTHHFFLHQQFHGLPFSQQHQQQRRLHAELGVGDGQDGGGFESSGAGSPPPKIVCGQLGVAPPPRFVATNFSLAVSEAAAAGEEAGLNAEAVDRSEHRSVPLPKWHHHLHPQPPSEEAEAEEEEVEAAIKEPFWKRPEILMEYMSRNGKSKAKASMEELAKAPVNQILGEEGKTTGSNYGFFSELEAIYNGGSGGSNQAGSGSALTGENTANPAGPAGNIGAGVDHGSETSAGEEVPRKKMQVRRRKSRQRELNSIAGFFEGLVKQLMDHQESLHSKFLEVMERREEERVEREDAWRMQESARINREAAARAREQALASTREAAIISYLEKISGENLKLPTKLKAYKSHTSPATDNVSNVEAAHQEKSNSSNLESETAMVLSAGGGRRWPKSEVQTLIKIRSGLEGKFQEPGLKAPLWDEVSESMAVLGYQRSAKRCKEKWENINKYFRKTKESAKKRPRHSKTCPYFHQLDELYSKDRPSSDQDIPAALPSSDLLDAIVVTTASERTPLITSFVDQLDHSFGYSDQVGSSMQLDDTSNDLAVNELNARQVLLQLQEDLGNVEDDDEDEDQDQDDGNEYHDNDDDEVDH